MKKSIENYMNAAKIVYGIEYAKKLEVRHHGGGSVYIRHPNKKSGVVVSEFRLQLMTKSLLKQS